MKKILLWLGALALIAIWWYTTPDPAVNQYNLYQKEPSFIEKLTWLHYCIVGMVILAFANMAAWLYNWLWVKGIITVIGLIGGILLWINAEKDYFPLVFFGAFTLMGWFLGYLRNRPSRPPKHSLEEYYAEMKN